MTASPQNHRRKQNSNRTILHALNPADLVVTAYLSIIIVLILISLKRVDGWPLFVGAHIVAILLVIAIARFDSNRRAQRSFAAMVGRVMHGWYLVPLIPASYFELGYLIPRVHSRDFDLELAAIDHKMFGVHPTVWLERFTHPGLTELLQLVYPTYYVLPIILGAVIWRKGWFARYDFWIFIVALGFYTSYLGYFAVPAIGPRFLPEIVAAQSKPLTGTWLFEPVRAALDRAERITRDCFPSGHTEVTLLVLYYARRLHRPTFWFLLPFGVGIIVSTVYLRYHYVVDVVAGAALALIIVVIAERRRS